MGDYNLLSGHLGHLTDTEETAFTTFKSDLEKAHLYTPPSADGVKVSHDDATLLRFLRARRFDPPAALKQFSDAEAWRKKHDVDAIYAKCSEEDLQDCRKFYPRFIGRRDKQGAPIYVLRMDSISGPPLKAFNKLSNEQRSNHIISLHEFMTKAMLPMCTALPHSTSPTPISNVFTIVDLENVGFMTLLSLRGHLGEVSTLATANYPETLGITAVVNAPSFFPTIWGWLKGWFDEGTRKKIHVLGRDPGETLRTFVELSNLPIAYGGEMEWSFGDEPILDQEAIDFLGIPSLPSGPVEFVDGHLVPPQKLD